MKYYVKSIWIISTIFLSLTISCNSQNSRKRTKITYFNEFTNYIHALAQLKNISTSEIAKKNIFILVDISCLDCVGMENLFDIADFYKTLNTNQQNHLLIIFVGKNDVKEAKRELKKIIRTSNGILDTENLAAHYEMNFSKILLVQTSEGKLLKYEDKIPINLSDIEFEN